MPSNVQSIINFGHGGVVVEAECQLSKSLPGITIVGLGSKAVDESKDRVRSALANCHIHIPPKRMTINLAPADIPKETTSLDLAIAISIIAASGQISRLPTKNEAVIGELGLTGTIRGVRGIIGKLLCGKEHGITRFYIPYANLHQALLVPGIEVVGLHSLEDLYFGLNDQRPLAWQATGDGIALDTAMPPGEANLSDVIGQERAKRAIEIAAAGGHNILLSGPPGMGKSMLAKALSSVLPPLSREEMLEITHLHSLVSGSYDQLVTARPFRGPHHSASHIAVVGGGNHLRPGEVSLAHQGVLFLDELPEFQRNTLEALRQPLEDRSITVARARESATFPANFILVATANPCPCGNFGTSRECLCPAHRIMQYRQKLSGPIMDRIDLYVDVDEVNHNQLLGKVVQDDEQIKRRIRLARKRQHSRYSSGLKLNAHATNKQIKTQFNLSAPAEKLLNSVASQLGLSARGYMRLIRVARTIADLEQSDGIEVQHVSEAAQYRAKNNQTIA